MAEVFTNVVMPAVPSRYVTVEVHVSDEPADVTEDSLDAVGQHKLRTETNNREREAVSGIAKIAWKSADAHDAFEAFLQKTQHHRWDCVTTYTDDMKAGYFPPFGHAYLHPSLTDRNGLIVIDGSRRTLAYLRSGHTEMPIVVFRAITTRTPPPTHP